MQNKSGSVVLPFVVGLVAALIVGWWLFPQIIFSEQSQPFNFNHKIHQEQGMTCKDCHQYREDGSFAGIPDLESCTMCHFDVMTDKKSEKIFIEEYVRPQKEIPWKVYQKQPDNVYFSHIAHSIEHSDCESCHEKEANSRSLTELDSYDEEPFKFSHKMHMEQGMQCVECHKDPESDSYTAMPSLESCTMCHFDLMTGSEADEKFVNQYVLPGKEIPWEEYRTETGRKRSEAHDFFDCSSCHIDMDGRVKSPPYYENILTGYSKQTMKMDECERCHAKLDASNACYVCHK